MPLFEIETGRIVKKITEEPSELAGERLNNYDLTTNLCTRDIMYRCSSNDATVQTLCTFWCKASFRDGCTHYRSGIGGACDSVKAQINYKKNLDNYSF